MNKSSCFQRRQEYAKLVATQLKQQEKERLAGKRKKKPNKKNAKDLKLPPIVPSLTIVDSEANNTNDQAEPSEAADNNEPQILNGDTNLLSDKPINHIAYFSSIAVDSASTETNGSLHQRRVQSSPGLFRTCLSSFNVIKSTPSSPKRLLKSRQVDPRLRVPIIPPKLMSTFKNKKLDKQLDFATNLSSKWRAETIRRNGSLRICPSLTTSINQKRELLTLMSSQQHSNGESTSDLFSKLVLKSSKRRCSCNDLSILGSVTTVPDYNYDIDLFKLAGEKHSNHPVIAIKLQVAQRRHRRNNKRNIEKEQKEKEKLAKEEQRLKNDQEEEVDYLANRNNRKLTSSGWYRHQSFDNVTMPSGNLEVCHISQLNFKRNVRHQQLNSGELVKKTKIAGFDFNSVPLGELLASFDDDDAMTRSLMHKLPELFRETCTCRYIRWTNEQQDIVDKILSCSSAT